MIAMTLAITFSSCGYNNSEYREGGGALGKSIGLVLLWSYDGDGMNQGTAPFNLYEYNDAYYIDFYGEMCRLKRISPINIGDKELCYSFASSKVGQYTYYLEDISQYSKRFFNND